MFADDNVVGDLDEVVDLGAASDDGGFYGTSVDGCVCTNFDVVMNDDGSHLRDF